MLTELQITAGPTEGYSLNRRRAIRGFIASLATVYGISQLPISYGQGNAPEEFDIGTLQIPVNPDGLIDDGEYEAIEHFSTALNNRNNNLWTPKFEELNDNCIALYVKIKETGFLEPLERSQDLLESPQLVTIVNQVANDRMKEIRVFFPDLDETKNTEARFFFVSATNRSRRTISGIRPAIKIPAMKVDRELLIIRSVDKKFITPKWSAASTLFKKRVAPFAAAMTDDSNGLIVFEDMDLDPDETKEFLVFFTLKDNSQIFFTIAGANIPYKDTMPCALELEVYYRVRDFGNIDGSFYSFEAKNWEHVSQQQS